MRFVKIFIAASALFLLTVGSVNFAVDPYGFWRTGLLTPQGVRAEEPRFYHPLRLAGGGYDLVFLGSSRVREGYRTYGPNSYNAGMSGASAFEIGKFMSFLAAHNPPKKLFVGLDFFNFAPGALYVDGSEKGPLGGRPVILGRLKTLFEIRTLKDSLKTIYKNLKGKAKPLPVVFSGYAEGNTRARFYAGLREHAARALAGFNPEVTSPDEAIMQGFLSGLKDMLQAKVEVTLVINPLPAARVQLIEGMGLSRHYDAVFGRLLHSLEGLQTAEAGYLRFWDFSVCVGAALEPVPLGEDKTMHWFYDSNHFKSDLGDVVLGQIYEGKPQKNVLAGRLLWPVENKLPSFARDWAACRVPALNPSVKDIVEQTYESRCAYNAQWCGR